MRDQCNSEFHYMEQYTYKEKNNLNNLFEIITR